MTQAGGEGSEARTVATLLSLLTLGLVDNQLLAPILPDIAASLAVEETSVGRTVSAYAIAAAVAALVVGPMSDRVGRGRFLVLSGVVFGFGSVLVVAAESIWVFVAARIVTGAAAGVISALTVAAIADLVPYERRGRVMGWVAVAYFAAPILGVPFAAFVADRVGWRVNYIVFALSAGSAAAFVARWFREPDVHHAHPARPFGYLRFFRARSTAAGALSAFFVTGGLTGFLLFLGAYLRSTFGLSLTEVGLVFLLSGIASLFGALLAGRLSDRVGKLRVALAGSAGLAIFFLIVPATSGVALYATLACVGLSAAARVAPLQSIVTQVVSRESRGAYVALRNTLSQGGSATAAAIASEIYERGFQYICWMTAGFSAVAFVLILFIDEPGDAKE